MKTVRVCVATTLGPVTIQDIVPEDPELRSVVCLNGTAETLAISNAYDAFVRAPTGVVERRFGHRVYRTDVDGQIDEGRSWQLAFFLAHWLHSLGCLARSGDIADLVVWASGTVDRSLTVGPVGRVTAKFSASADWFDRMRAERQAVLVLLPHGEEGIRAEPVWHPPDGLTCQRVRNASEAESLIEVALGGRPSEAAHTAAHKPAIGASRDQVPGPRARLRRRVGIAAALGLGGVLFAVALHAELPGWISEVRSDRFAELDARLATAEKGASDCLFCRPLLALHSVWVDRFRSVSTGDVTLSAVARPRQRFDRCLSEGPETVLAADLAGKLPEVSVNAVCMVEYRLRNVATSSRAVVVTASIAFVDGEGDRATRMKVLAPDEILTLKLPLEEWRNDALMVRLRIAFGPAALIAHERWIADMLEKADWRGRLGRLGLETIDALHQLETEISKTTTR